MITLPNEYTKLVFREKILNGKDYSFRYDFVGKDGAQGTFETPFKNDITESFKACYLTGQTCSILDPPDYNREHHRDIVSNFKVIVDDSRDFKMGYKMVMMSDGSFAYVREEDEELLPYRFDVASDFNDFGFAMVGLRCGVSWINTRFELLEGNKFCPLDSLDIFDSGTLKMIGEFSGTESSMVSPLLENVMGGTAMMLSYLNERGELQEFKKYDGKIGNEGKSSFLIQRKKVVFRGYEEIDIGDFSFDNGGYIRLENCIYFSRGFYVTFEDLIRLSCERGWIQNLDEEVKQMLIEPIENKDKS